MVKVATNPKATGSPSRVAWLCRQATMSVLPVAGQPQLPQARVVHQRWVRYHQEQGFSALSAAEQALLPTFPCL